MLGWLRRNDGFEWHKYVRTTIKLRREDRKRRLKAAQGAVKQQLQGAGKSSVAASRSALGALWSGIARWSVEGAEAGRRAAAGLAGGLGRLLPARARSAVGAFGQPRVRLLVGIAGAAVVLAALWHDRQSGLSPLVLQAAIGIGAIALLYAAASALGWLLRRGWLVIDGLALRLARLPPLAGFGPSVMRSALLALVVAAGFASLWWAAGGSSARLPVLPTFTAKIFEGRASAVAGDTLRIGNDVVRLAGIEAPEWEQRCVRPGNRRWRCGMAATEALSARLKGTSVSCTKSGLDDSGRILGRCRIGADDLGALMVREGHVFASTGFLARYGAIEAEAKARKVGVWSGEAERPEEFRQRRWEEAKKRAPSGCPIKGTVSASSRTYVLPWSANYEQVKVRANRGERWFCSESEAIGAGWRYAGGRGAS
jgi:endonuclease YncB( thermonuclease family)